MKEIYPKIPNAVTALVIPAVLGLSIAAIVMSGGVLGIILGAVATLLPLALFIPSTILRDEKKSPSDPEGIKFTKGKKAAAIIFGALCTLAVLLPCMLVAGPALGAIIMGAFAIVAAITTPFASGMNNPVEDVVTVNSSSQSTAKSTITNKPVAGNQSPLLQ